MFPSLDRGSYGMDIPLCRLAQQRYSKFRNRQRKSPENFGGLRSKTLFSVQLNRERDQFFAKAVECAYDFFSACLGRGLERPAA